MSKKIMVLALAAVSAALFALPSVASAGVWHIDKAEKFTLSNEGHTTLTEQGSAAKITCTAVAGGGTYTTTTEGNELTFTFSGCTETVFNSACTTSGQAGGTIKTVDLFFENILIDKETPGILISPFDLSKGTPKEGEAKTFATFTCLGGLISKTVTGNGIIGHVTTKCGAAATTTHTIDFESAETGKQKYMQVTTTGVKYDLHVAGPTTASQDGNGLVHFPNAQKVNCT